MKKILLVVSLLVCSTFTFAMAYDNYEALYNAVSMDPELNKIEDWEQSLQIIWSYAESNNVQKIEYEIVKDLLLNPTELEWQNENFNY